MGFSETIHGAPDCPTDSINVLHQPSQSCANNMADVKSAIVNRLLTETTDMLYVADIHLQKSKKSPITTKIIL